MIRAAGLDDLDVSFELRRLLTGGCAGGERVDRGARRQGVDQVARRGRHGTARQRIGPLLCRALMPPGRPWRVRDEGALHPVQRAVGRDGLGVVLGKAVHALEAVPQHRRIIEPLLRAFGTVAEHECPQVGMIAQLVPERVLEVFQQPHRLSRRARPLHLRQQRIAGENTEPRIKAFLVQQLQDALAAKHHPLRNGAVEGRPVPRRRRPPRRRRSWMAARIVPS